MSPLEKFSHLDVSKLEDRRRKGNKERLSRFMLNAGKDKRRGTGIEGCF